MDKLSLLALIENKLKEDTQRYIETKRNLKIAIRNKQTDIKDLETSYWNARNSLKLTRRKLLYLTNPNGLYIEEFYSKRHKSMRGWEMKLGKSLVELFQIKDMVDFGCGLGAYLEGALVVGLIRLLGYDIMYEKAKPYTTDAIKPYLKYGNLGEPIDCGKWDCVLSIETAEHLLEEEADNFVNNLVNAANRIIVLSASNAGGRYHINRQLKPYWIEKLKNKGWIYSQDSVDKLYDIWHKNGCPGYILNNLMVYYHG